MVGPNKILTVSYGTFSCTLEGFDEPFDTMKAIAEYFRDLAAEDRYFGAEPPQPDAEMLHRIAEREIQRRVEARIQDGGVMLRPQIEAEAAPRVRVGAEARPAETAPSALAAAAPAQPLVDEAEAANAIAERLQRIRAAVARGAAPAAAPAAIDAEAEAARLAAARAAELAAAELAEEARLAAEAELARIEAERRDFEAAEQARLAAEAEAEAEAARHAAIEEARIAAEAAEAERARLAAEVAAEATRIEAARIEAEAAEQARIEAAEATRIETETAAEPAVEPEVLDPAPAPAAEAPRPPRRVVVVRPARPAAPVQEAAPAPAPEPQPEAVSQGGAAEAFQPAPQPPLAAPEHADLADEAELAPAAPIRAAQVEALPDEDEDEDEERRRWDEAAARIAAAAAPEAAPEATGETRADASALAALVESQRQAILREVSGEQAVARLISRTEAQLSDADAQRRQSTISHLKAAVRATRAEQEATGEIPGQAAEAADLARYRADLEREMQGDPDTDQPRRPVRTVAGRAERPAAAQAPLVLVSEQRIDRPASADVVLPRRVATDATALDELFDEAAPIRAPLGKAFTDFVAPMQLTTVAEMTEAAAAYITYVTGQEDFARPTVMKLVMSTEAPMTRSRENLLRAFGMLMRQGVLRRSRRGQFELAEDSSFGEKARRFASH